MSQLLFNKSYSKIKLPASIKEAVKSGIENDDIERYIIVVPTGRYARHLEHEIIFDYYEAKKKPLGNLRIFTLSDFAKYCFNMIFSGKNYHHLSEMYLLAIFEEAFKQANVQFFKSGNNKVSYALLKRLSDLITGLKEDGITVESVAAELNRNDDSVLPADKSRLEDIYSLYAAYQDILNDKYLDDTELLLKVTKAFSENFDSSDLFDDTKLILLEGFSEFKMPEVEFISSFVAAPVPMLIKIDYDDTEGPLYTILENSIGTLINNGFTINDYKEEHSGEKLAHIKHNLFGYNINKMSGFAKMIKIIESPSRVEEVILIARLIKYLILREGIPPSDICVALRQPGIYAPLFREIFFTHKIPTNISERFELFKSQVVVGIIAALEVINNGYRREDLIKFLKNPFISFAESDDDKIDVDNIISTTVYLRITGGHRRGGIDGILNYLEKSKNLYQKYVEKYNNDPDVDYFDKINASNLLKNIKSAIKDLQKVKNILATDSKKLKPSEFRDFIVKNIIARLNIVRNIKKNLDIEKLRNSGKSKIEINQIVEEIENNTKALTKLYLLLNEMVFILEERYPNREFSFGDLTERLKTAISGTKYQISEKVGYGVTVTTIEQTRQIPFRIMILPGCVDGEFPVPYHPEHLLGYKPENSELRHILAERMQFYNFISNAPALLESGEKRIYISYPKFTEESELVRSPFIDELFKVTTIEEEGGVIDYSIVKNAVQNRQFDKDSEELIEKFPWLHSVASDIDLHGSYALDFNSRNETEKDMFENISTHIKKNIQDYLTFIDSGQDDEIYIDKRKLPEEVKFELEKFTDIPVSISQLEKYAACPYKFFLEVILKIKAPDEFEPGMTPLEMGNILHKIVYAFYTKLAVSRSADNDNLPPITPVVLEPDKRKEYHEMLYSIAEETLATIAYDYPLFNLDKESILGSNRQAGIINIWLNNELNRIEKLKWKTVPVLFEFPFGMKTQEKYEIDAVNLDGLMIRGKIDRVELYEDAGEFIIADYKLSPNDDKVSNQLVEAGKIFQMSLYILAMHKIFKELYNLDYKPAGGVYYYFKTKYDNKKNKQIDFGQILVPQDSEVSKFIGQDKSRLKIEDSETLMKILTANLDAAKTIVQNISNGIFNVSPLKDETCKYCSLSSVCRINNLH